MALNTTLWSLWKPKKDGINRHGGGRLQANEILLLPIHGAILVDEFIDLVGIHLVRRDRIVIVVTG